MSETVREGGCVCGAVRYRVRGEPVGLAVCHCSDCQRQSGSAFGMSLIVHRNGLEITKGETACFAGRADSGAEKNAYFCPTCGARLYNSLSSMPETINVKPGTLDDTRWLEPRLQVWTDSKQPWVVMPASLPSFPRNPTRADG